MEIGGWRHRIVIQKNTITRDAMGNMVTAWEDYHACWAYVNHTSGREYEKAAQVNETELVFFKIRWCSKVGEMDSTNYRVKFRNHLYGIQAIHNEQFRNKVLKLTAERIKR